MPNIQKRKSSKQLDQNLDGSREKIRKWELAGCKIECADSMDPETPLSMGLLPSNMAKLYHARISFPCQDLKSFFPFLNVFVIPSIECGCSELKIFCKLAAAHLWMLSSFGCFREVTATI